LKFRNKTTFSLLLAITMCTALLSSAHASRAATSYVLSPTDPAVGTICASLGGSWDGSRTCTLGGNLNLNSGDSLLVNPGAVLAIPRGITLSNNGTIEYYGAITNNAGGFVANSGTITAYIGNGTINNGGSMTNGPSGMIGIEHPASSSAESGSFNFTNSGNLDNRGTFVDLGNFTNRAGASVTNSGSLSFESATINSGNFSAPVIANYGNLTNAAGGTITEGGPTIINRGTITNVGTIAEKLNTFSIIENLGTVTSNGTIGNFGLFENNGTITNSGAITNLVGCSHASCGSLSNFGVIVNTARGSIDNQGNMGNNPNATLTNDGILTNSRVFINIQNGKIGRAHV
jgi:hypothetical protein